MSGSAEKSLNFGLRRPPRVGVEERRMIVVITGGTRGIGAATARLAVEAGHRVCLVFRRDEGAAQALCRELSSGQVLSVRADVGVEADVLRVFETVDRHWGRLDALVNNAAVVAPQMRLDEMSAERISLIFATNVLGPFLFAREAVRRMSTRHGGSGGSIVNVSSVAARLGSPGEYIDYAASKGALDTMTLGLAREVAAEGIRVNCVRPGLIYTDIHASGGEPGRVKRLESGVPMGRGGQPEEIARAILWLLSDQASYTSGAILDVTGGR